MRKSKSVFLFKYRGEKGGGGYALHNKILKVITPKTKQNKKFLGTWNYNIVLGNLHTEFYSLKFFGFELGLDL